MLAARRPSGQDDASPLLGPALDLARQDPVLGAWLRRQETFDRAVANASRAVPPPVGLRESILAGESGRVPSGAGVTRWSWAIAASLALIGLLGGWGLHQTKRPPVDDLVAFALHDVVAEDHAPSAEFGHGQLAAALTKPAVRLGAGSPIDFSRLAEQGCRSLKIGGREVFEICFQREGSGTFHLYIALEKDFKENEALAELRITDRRDRSWATWAENGRRFVLVSQKGGSAIRNLL